MICFDFGHFGLSLNAEGQVVVRAGQEAVTSLEKVSLRCWYSIVAKIGVSGRISIALATLENGQNYQPFIDQTDIEANLTQNAPIVIAGQNISNVVQNFFNGKSVVFTGTLNSISRDEAKYMAKEVGAKILSSVTKNTDYVIVGDKAGSKEKKAKELNINIFSEKDFLKKVKS